MGQDIVFLGVCTFKMGMYIRPRGKPEGVALYGSRYNLREREVLSLSVSIPNAYFPRE